MPTLERPAPTLDEYPNAHPVLHAVHELVQYWAQKTPQATAVLEGSNGLTYFQFQELLELAARIFLQNKIEAGHRVVFVAENSIAMAACCLALSSIGAWPVLANARLTVHELNAICENCNPAAVVFTHLVSPDAAAHAQHFHCSEIQLAQAGAILFSRGRSLESFFSTSISATPEPRHPNNLQNVAALIYTSGTIGKPKGVMLSHSNLLFVAESSSRLRRLKAADRVCGMLPMSHVYGLSSVFLATLHAGASIVFMPRFSPAVLLQSFATQNISVLQTVPTVYLKILEMVHSGRAELNAPSLNYLHCGGSPLDATLKASVETLFGLPLHHGYGLTETSPTIAQTQVESPATDCTVGQPIPGVEIQFVDFQENPIPTPHSIGELWVRGPNVMLGYYRDAEQTQKVTTPDGWFKTGDLGYQAENGFLYISGRSKDLIVHSGFNVYPAEVEQEINSFPGVLQSAVIGRPAKSNEDVLAFVVCQPGVTLNLEALEVYLTQRLSPYKRPFKILVVHELPLTQNGKINKNHLQSMADALLRV